MRVVERGGARRKPRRRKQRDREKDGQLWEPGAPARNPAPGFFLSSVPGASGVPFPLWVPTAPAGWATGSLPSSPPRGALLAWVSEEAAESPP